MHNIHVYKGMEHYQHSREACFVVDLKRSRREWSEVHGNSRNGDNLPTVACDSWFAMPVRASCLKIAPSVVL